MFISNKFTKVYVVPVCAGHNKREQHFEVTAGTLAVEDPTIGVVAVVKMGLNHMMAANFTLVHKFRE